LTDAKDPRVTGDGMTFERPPFSGPLVSAPEGKRGRKASKTEK
jgi:hypothetical protein